jgi:hypothetical protein
MASFPQPCGQDASRAETSAVTAFSRQGLDAQGTGAILNRAVAGVTLAMADINTARSMKKIVRKNAIKLYGLDLDEQSACRYEQGSIPYVSVHEERSSASS